jgi:hypothetical protein
VLSAAGSRYRGTRAGLGFTNATAFSPTDVMPLARWAKTASKTERTIINAAGLVQGIVLVTFPAASPSWPRH